MSAILIGVDSGGTRTNVQIKAGAETFSHEINRSLSGSLAPSEYAAVLRAILLPAEAHLMDLAATDRVAIFIGAAGFTPSFRDDFREAALEVLPHMLAGRVDAVGIANDAPCLLLAYDAEAVVIAGTGSNVVVRAKDGNLHQSGGHEWVVSDYGSGFWIGLLAIRQAYRDLESDTESVLLHRLIEAYGVRSGDQRRLIAKFRDLAIADENLKPEIARFAAPVCAAAERGDGSAQDIVKREAEDLADSLAGALRRRFNSDELADGVQVVECGGLLSNNFYRQAFRSQVEMRLKTGGRPSQIQWNPVGTGTDAALRLAARVAEHQLDVSQVASDFRPLVMRFD